MSAFLDKLKEFLSKNFLLSAFVPVFVCLAVNALLLYRNSEWFRQVVRTKAPADGVAGLLEGGAVAFAVAVIAGLVSPSLTFFREVLEGKHWIWPFRLLRGPMVGLHSRWLEAATATIRQLQRDGRELRRNSERWLDELARARNAEPSGKAQPRSRYQARAMRSRHRGDVVGLDALQLAKTELRDELEHGSLPSRELDDRYAAFIRLLQYAPRRLDAEIIDRTNDRLRRWGQAAVAPTEMGNLAEAIAAYGMLRYGFSLEIGWSRLQRVLRDDKQLATLQDVKASFDAVVLLFWLIALTTLGWSVWLVCRGDSAWFFAGVAVGGAVACELLYRTAVTSYLQFGEVLRGSIDLYRFDLLRALHLPLPATLQEEIALWKSVQRQQEFGETPDVTYDHAKEKSS